jgi:DNA-binding NtrC family response regulator
VHVAQRTGQSHAAARASPANFHAGRVWHARRILGGGMSAIPNTNAQVSAPGYHGAVSDFKRRLIEATLHQARGNRTHAARALGLQRTYLLRLIRELGVAAPPPAPRRGHSAAVPPRVG